jgi:hypothetical protein
VIVEPGLIKSQKNRLGSEWGSVSLEKLEFSLDIYPGALAILWNLQKLHNTSANLAFLGVL